MTQAPKYSTGQRRSYIRTQLHRYRVTEKSGFSLRDITYDVQQYFGMDRPPSPTTIKTDLALLEKEAADNTAITYEDDELLAPENFPLWRSTMFVAPQTNEPYETPTHQFAWFWLVVSLALKIEMPEWVVEWFLEHDPTFKDFDLNDWARNKNRLMSLMLLAPPRHGKSDLLGHTLVWLICRQPNIRIIWCGGSLPISKLTTAWIKGELEANEELIRRYGPFETNDNWSNESLTVATRTVRSRAPTLVALGKGSTVLSRDADIIILDDFVDLRASLSPTTIANDVIWVKSQLMTRREPWTPLLGIGSHQPSQYGDAYEYMAEDKNSNMKFVRIKAHDYEKCHSQVDDPEREAERHGDWCLLWMSLRPWWYLEDMRNDLGDITYEVCYNQDAGQGRISYFAPEILRADFPQPVPDNTGRSPRPDLSVTPAGILDRRRSWGVLPHCCGSTGNLVTTIGFDPASSTKKGASESALSVRAACRVCLRRYRIDYWKGRVSPEQHSGTIIEWIRTYRPLRVRIEINAYQKALAREKSLVDAQSELGFIIDENFTDQKKWDPALGVPLMSRHMERGMESMPYAGPHDLQKSEEIIRQYLRWPQPPNDMVMADWLAEMSLQDLLEELTYAVPDRLTDEDDIPDALLAGEFTVDMSLITP
jgi:hypothetical protein